MCGQCPTGRDPPAGIHDRPILRGLVGGDVAEQIGVAGAGVSGDTHEQASMRRKQAVVAVIPPLRSARNIVAPSLRLKSADPAEFPVVGCDEDKPPGQRAASYQRVVGTDGAPLF